MIEKLGLDDKDVKLFTLVMINPDISQAELAKALKISQPSVNVRLRKLKDRGILAQSVGIEFNKTGLVMGRVDFASAEAKEIMDTLKGCSFFVNGFITSGTKNASILIVADDLKKIEAIVNEHIRNNPAISEIDMSVVVSSSKPFVFSVNLEQGKHPICHEESCKDCPL